MSHVIGIDIGSSSIKVAAMDEKATLSFVLSEGYFFTYPEKNYIEISLNEVWEKVKSLLAKAIDRVRKEGGMVAGISLSTFCNSTVMMNEEGIPLYPGIVYMDQRSESQAHWIKETVGVDHLYKVTKNRIEPGMFSITTLLWLKENKPDLYEAIYMWGNLSTFIYHKLTGEFVMDWTQASFTGIFDITEYEWSESICSALGIPLSILPEIAAPGENLGVANALLDDIPVIVGGADTACSALALGLENNEVFESVGTSNVLTVCTDSPEILDTRFLNRCHVVKGSWLSHGAMSTPGASIRWFYDTFLKSDEEDSSVLEDLPGQSDIGANGLFFLPYMQGERSPIWDPNARGAYVGMHLNTSKADFLQAIFEGCAFGLRQIQEIIEEKYQLKCESYQSIGGGAQNKVWVQIKSNVLNKNIETMEVNEAAVYGTCLIAGSSLGHFPPLSEMPTFLKNKVLFMTYPSEKEVEQYAQLYEIFVNLYPSLKGHFRKVNT
ncbi:xylulokinase [Halobacillus ihumii]|uniref:xylulokinase n=1 Tax=Halobacillus ihumii TaxID=2686092 RepID=UPI0013D20B6C|nr:FGGY family carbohydrate kinase [Halobacillus ihumii]